MGVKVDEINSDKLSKFLNKTAGKELYKDKAYNHCIKADALRIKKHFTASIQEYKNSIQFKSNNPEAYKGMGIALKETGKLQESLQALDNARKLTPFDKTIYLEVAKTHIEEGKPCPAAKVLIKAIKLDPKYLDAHFRLAIAHEMLEEEDMAIIIYNKIIEERPSYVAAYSNLGSLYMRLEVFEKAIATFLNLIKINPEFSRAYLGIAVAFDNLERHTDAVRYYKKYLKQKPYSANSEHIKERLCDIRASKKCNLNHAGLKLLK